MYKKIEKLLNERNETAYHAAMTTGISQTAFSNWKAGRSKPELESLRKLSNHFGVSIEYFLDE